VAVVRESHKLFLSLTRRENLHERFEQYINGSGKIFIQILPSDSKKSCGKLEVRLLYLVLKIVNLGENY
jgi:hypothetical protein